MHRALERVEALPGVRSASVTARAPLAVNFWANDLMVEGHQQAPDEDPYLLDITLIDEHYFDLLGVPILRGRGIQAADEGDAPRVAVVSAAFARRYWPGDEAVGKWIRRNTLDGEEYRIVGVSADYKVRSVTEQPRPMVHFSRYQRGLGFGSLLFLTDGDAARLLPEVTRAIRELDPRIAFFESSTLASNTQITLSPLEMGASLVSIFGFLTMVLAAVGLYGIVAHSVAVRRKEFGIRMALGATSGEILRGVMRRGLTLTAAGAALGAAGAFLLTRALSDALFGVSSFDASAFLGAFLVIALVSGAANALPAVRAARVDPMIILRQE